METNYSKVFAKKLIALFLSVLMALTCFTGALSAFAASKASDKDYHDSNLAVNFMTWAETTDEQTAEALLDWADLHLEDLMTSLLGSSNLKIYYNAVVLTIDINGYLDSIDGVFDLLSQVDALVKDYAKLLGGDIKNIDLAAVGRNLSPSTDSGVVVSKCGKSYRSQYSAKELIVSLAKAIYVNSNDLDGKNVIGEFLKGTLDLGSIINTFLKKSVYDLLQDTLGMWDGYETNLVYNIVANLILENTKWFTNEELSAYRADIRGSSRTYAFNFDKVLVKALNEKLLDEIHVEITYPNYVVNENGDPVNDSSVKRYKRICESMGKDILDGTVDQTSTEFKAKAQLDADTYGYTYDPDIIYFTNNTKDSASTADMTKDTGCVYLFQLRNDTGIDKLTFAYDDGTTNKITDENLYSFAFNALKYAWQVALEPTIGLVHVNYSVDRNKRGTNFDNAFFYWMSKTEGKTWNTTNWKSNYSAANVEAWAEAVCESYGFESATDFLAEVRHDLHQDRAIVDNAKNNWQDINSKQLFNKLRYSPLADLYFDMQTGPINLYFEQTGIDPISTFFDTAFDNYANMVAALNDALVAVTKVVFVSSDNGNIGWGSTGEEDYLKPQVVLNVPEMATTRAADATGVTDVNISSIVTKLIGNVLDMFEYAANVTDANILSGFYHSADYNQTLAQPIPTADNLTNNLEEASFEGAMIPLLVACLQNINMVDPIHDAIWDSCKDAEGVAIVALEEYLSFVLPDKDYSVLYTHDAEGYIVAKSGQTLFENAVMPMCRDALGYIISSVVPCRYKNGNQWVEWNVYDSNPTDSVTIFEILNSVLCYYAGQDGFADGTSGKGVATLLGVVNSSSNQPLVTISNTLWENLDNIINELLPAIGTAQYGTVDGYGKANSKQLLYYDIIKGILDIGEETTTLNADGTTTSSGRLGVSNFVYKFLTIITSTPVSANIATPQDKTSGNTVVEMLYNLIADVANNLFGSRTNTQYPQVIPYANFYDKDTYSDTNTVTPFDSLLVTSTIGKFSGDNGSSSNNNGDGKATGVLGILIYNIYRAFGGTTGSTPTAGTANGTSTSFVTSSTGTDGCWDGAMFAVTAVNNFIPSFCPSLSDHTLKTATAKVADPAISGATAGNSFGGTTLIVTNNSIGLNRFYKDSNGNIQRRPRYFMYVKSIKQTVNTTASLLTLDGSSNETVTVNQVVQPEKALRLALTGNAPANPTTYTFEVTYDLFEGEMNGTTKPTYSSSKVVDGCSNLKTTAFMYITSEDDWAKTVYDSEGHFTSNVTQLKSPGGSVFTNEYSSTGISAYGGTGNNLGTTLPTTFIVPKSNAQSIDNKCFLAINCHRSNPYYLDGIFATLMAGDQYYSVSGTTMDSISDTLTTAPANSNSSLANRGISNTRVGYAAIDPLTGDILNCDRYDYTVDGGETWVRGPVNGGTTPTTYFDNYYYGFSAEEINSKITSTSSNDALYYDSRVAAAKANGTFGTRQHVCWTLEDAVASGSVYGVQRTKSRYDSTKGEYIYTYQGVLLNFDSTYMQAEKANKESAATIMIGSSWAGISCGTPTPGIYFATSKTQLAKAGWSSTSQKWLPLMKYDGVTEIEADSYSMGVNVYTTNNNNLIHKIDMYIADDASSSQLTSEFNDALKLYSTYSEDDIEDITKYNDLADALKAAVATAATPINRGNAASLGNQTEVVPKTNDDDQTIGDRAYKPVTGTEGVSGELAANAVKGTSDVDGNEYWYYNKECTIPICKRLNSSNANDIAYVTDDDVVTIGSGDSAKTVLKASSKMEVVEVDGAYYYKNSPKYEYVWDTTTYKDSNNVVKPYLVKDTSTQATDIKGKPIYERISFTCYDEAGKSMDSRGEWTYCIADRKTVIKENLNGTDYRGIYQMDIDALQYYSEQLKKSVNNVAELVVENVSDDRQGLNNVNYEVASYEKMVQVAKASENLIWYEKDPECVEKTYANNSYGAKVEVTLSPKSTSIDTLYEDEWGNEYKDSKVWTEVDYVSKSDNSLVNINASIALYDDFKGYMKSRGYIGDKLEAEISCATTPENAAADYVYSQFGYTKDESIVYVPQEVDAKGQPTNNPYSYVARNYTVTGASNMEAEYGAYNEDGVLVNEGEIKYTEESWNNYVNALGAAIEYAKVGNGDLTGVTYLSIDETNDAGEVTASSYTPVTAKVSGAYTAKTDLQKAENNLEVAPAEEPPVESNEITISGTVTIATDVPATVGEAGIVDLGFSYVDPTTGETVALGDEFNTADDGSFEIQVPAGTTSITVSGHSAVPRTVTLTGAQDVTGVTIPINVCDYVANDRVDAFDYLQFNKVMNGDYDVYYDIVKNEKVDAFDYLQFNKFMGYNIAESYAELSLD